MTPQQLVGAAVLVLWSFTACAAGQWQGQSYPAARAAERATDVPVWETFDTGGSGAPDDRRDFLTDIAFSDDRHGWTCGYGGVFATHDGGATWRRQWRALRPPESWCHLELDAAGRPWVLVRLHGRADARLLRGDGMGEWTSVAAPLTGAQDFLVRDGQMWVLGGMQGGLYSDDGGARWQEIDFGGELSGAFRLTRLTDGVNGGAVYVLGMDNGRPVLVYSPDGRSGWERIALPQGLPTAMHAYSLHFATTQRGVVGLPDGGVAVTSDGGKTWRQQNLRSGHHVTALFMLPDGRIHAAVRNDDVDFPGPAIFYSPNLGRTWLQAVAGRMQVNVFIRNGGLLWGAGSVPGRVANDLLLSYRIPVATP